jgi:ribosomal protein S18 acetylase RimI-like enzyme
VPRPSRRARRSAGELAIRDPSVRRARRADLEAIARIGAESFSGLRPLSNGRRWVRACWAARPRMRYWVAADGRAIVAYILWLEKGGFRSEAVLELEQIAVSPDRRGQGIGKLLVQRSFRALQQGIEGAGRRVKAVEVTTGAEQHAVAFYRRALGARRAATVPDLFRGDEHILIARPPFPVD